ncbi:YncE family protein [Corticibacter populi]|uniref:YncE family protein n=1 Tax=Corticibacter populi TaxID=1550736 RepID=A0A3M6QKL9_9BURK|nr:YncE family protein [Corticibacter populi]
MFVASAGGFGDDAPASKVLRLNPDTLAIEAEITLPLRGFGVVLDDAQDRLYVSHGLDGAISVIDTASGRIIGRIALAAKVRGADGKEKFEHHFRELVLDAAHHRLYAPGLSSEGSALYVINTRTLQLEKVMDGFGPVATGIALDAAGQRLFVSNLRGNLYEVDTQNLTVAQSHSVGADQLINLAYDTRGQRLLATDQGLDAINARRQASEPGFVPTPGNRVVVFDPATAAITASIPTGAGPIALLLDEARQRLFVTNRGAGTVTVFDARSHALLQTFELPKHPNSLAFDARRNVLYVSVKNGREAERGGAESVVRIAF